VIDFAGSRRQSRVTNANEVAKVVAAQPPQYSRHCMKVSVDVEPRDHRGSTIGMDIQSVSEIGASLERFGERFTAHLFTQREIEACHGTPNEAARYYAEGFAAKEAVLKILDVREFVPPWKSIELRRSSGGPQIELHGSSAELARRQGIDEIRLSMSCAGDAAIAVAVARVARRSA
jgi:holo-[acyl-carrier protein] synthase